MLKEALAIGVVAYVFVILTSPGMIFYFWYKLIDKIPYDFIFKPLGGCNMCFGGQLALYFYLIKYFHSYSFCKIGEINIWDYFITYFTPAFLNHIFFISGTILTVMILDKLIDYET